MKFTRECRHCMKEFSTEARNRQTCSDKCSKERKAGLNKSWRDRVVRRNRLFILDYIGGTWKCSDCDSKYPSMGWLDWHHLESEEKLYDITWLLDRNKHDALVEELAKCILVCPNCHRKRHIEGDSH